MQIILMDENNFENHEDERNVLWDLYYSLDKRGRDIFKECIDEQINSDYPLLVSQL